MTQRINLSDECVELVEALSPLPGPVNKVRVGRLWEVPVDQATYAMLRDNRRVDESWSEAIMRLVRQSQRLGDARG